MKKIQKTEWQQTLRAMKVKKPVWQQTLKDIVHPLVYAYTQQEIADYLNLHGIRTYTDKLWTRRQVGVLLRDLNLLPYKKERKEK